MVESNDGTGYTVSNDIDVLIEQYEDVHKLFNGTPNQYEPSQILPQITWHTQSLCDKINRTFFEDPEEALRLFHELVPGAAESVSFRPPFRVDYGVGLKIGERTFINMDFMIIGGNMVTIGENCLIGPRCTISTPNHALDVAHRDERWEYAQPVTIGDGVWLGANVTILPGVTIGAHSIIGAGSVVVKDIPENVIAVGNPCHVIREVPQLDPVFKDVPVGE